MPPSRRLPWVSWRISPPPPPPPPPSSPPRKSRGWHAVSSCRDPSAALQDRRQEIAVKIQKFDKVTGLFRICKRQHESHQTGQRALRSKSPTPASASAKYCRARVIWKRMNACHRSSICPLWAANIRPSVTCNSSGHHSDMGPDEQTARAAEADFPWLQTGRDTWTLQPAGNQQSVIKALPGLMPWWSTRLTPSL